MLEAKQFKGFATYFVSEPFTHDEIATAVDDSDYNSIDPTGSQYNTIGFGEVLTGETHLDVEGAATLLNVQINERILPASVVKEKMRQTLDSIEEREGRRPGRKEFAQVKDEVLQTWLPKSHIRRKQVPVLIRGRRLFVFTTSAKLADSVCMFLQRVFDKSMQWAMLAGVSDMSPANVLTVAATDGDVDDFTVTTEAVLKGKDKQTIRIKDKDIVSDDVEKLIADGFQVTTIGLSYGEDDDQVVFTLNEHLVVSKLQFAGVPKPPRAASEAELSDNLIAAAWLIATGVNSLVDAIGATFCANGKLDKSIDKLFSKVERRVDLLKTDDDDEL